MPSTSRTIRSPLSDPRVGTSVTFAGLLVALVLGSCADEPPEETEAPVADTPEAPADPPPDQLPLPEIMRGLERDMAAVDAGLWRESPQAVAPAARRVADHPTVTPEYLEAIQEALGEDFPAFVEYDQEVHDVARHLAERAEAGAPIAELLEIRYEVAQGCVGCHTDFRGRLQPTMDRLRSEEP